MIDHADTVMRKNPTDFQGRLSLDGMKGSQEK